MTHHLELVWGERVGNLDNLCGCFSFFCILQGAEVCLSGKTLRGSSSRKARTEASSRILTKWMNPAAVSHVLIKMESRFTSLMELLCKRDKKARCPSYRRPCWEWVPEQQHPFREEAAHPQAPSVPPS